MLAAGAAAFVLRCWALARKLDPQRDGAVRPPMADLAAVARRVAGFPVPAWRFPPSVALATAGGLAMCAAFTWDWTDHGTFAGAAMVAGVEGALMMAGFGVLGRTLGLRR